MKKQTGITLIALIVTVIVLLILAGVSISMIVGNNGILTQAENAVIETREANALEAVLLAWTSVDGEYWEAWSNDFNTDKTEYYIPEKLNSYLTGKGYVSSIVDNGENKYTVDYISNEDSLVYTMEIDSNGNGNVIESGMLFSTQINTDNYGDYVNYEKDLGLNLILEGEDVPPLTDWKIFYKDTQKNRIYLIAADYVPNTCSLLKTSEAGMSVNGEFSLYWKEENVPNELSEIERHDSIFGITEDSYILNENNANSRCISTLLDTYYWKNLVDSTVADYAIGGPTIEMFADSWNENGYKQLTESSSSFGYRINDALWVDLEDDIGYSNNLYFPHADEFISTEQCWAYRIAAPSDNYQDIVLGVGCSGVFADRAYSEERWGIRPVVALKPGVKATKDENGIWQLEE